MKITKAYQNKEEIIAACMQNYMYKKEFVKLISTTTKVEFENLLLANFGWCVERDILEEWLPDELPNCTKLDCTGCENLTKLPKLKNCKILNCSHCLNLEQLSELGNCEYLDCSDCPKLKELPPLPKCRKLYYVNCPNLILPELSNDIDLINNKF